MQVGHVPIYKTKVTLLGEYSVGKTSIAAKFTKNVFNQAYSATVGGSFSTRKITVEDKTFMLQIWDTAGSERYRALVPMYLRDTSAAVVVYDVTRKTSFDELPYWLDQLFKYAPLDVVVVVVGNKIDLSEERAVTTKNGKDFALLGKYLFFETSAKTGENVEEIFSSIGRSLSSRTLGHVPERQDALKIDIRISQKTKSSRCCFKS